MDALRLRNRTMSKLLFHSCVFVDRILATDLERRDARGRVATAIATHGAGAYEALRTKLGDRRRRKSRRSIRLAIAALVEGAA